LPYFPRPPPLPLQTPGAFRGFSLAPLRYFFSYFFCLGRLSSLSLLANPPPLVTGVSVPLPFCTQTRILRRFSSFPFLSSLLRGAIRVLEPLFRRPLFTPGHLARFPDYALLLIFMTCHVFLVVCCLLDFTARFYE